jgi:hypothetical protein
MPKQHSTKNEAKGHTAENGMLVVLVYWLFKYSMLNVIGDYEMFYRIVRGDPRRLCKRSR